MEIFIQLMLLVCGPAIVFCITFFSGVFIIEKIEDRKIKKYTGNNIKHVTNKTNTEDTNFYIKNTFMEYFDEYYFLPKKY